jgi:hypothetical protein
MRKTVTVSLQGVLLVVLACLVGSGERVAAQTTPPRTIDCGPFRVNAGDFVALNVGNPAAAPADVLVRLFDRDGQELVSQRLALNPGTSRTVRWPSSRGPGLPLQALVRGELVVEAGLAQARVRGTIQVFGRDLTYGPDFECSGDTGGRGPV